MTTSLKTACILASAAGVAAALYFLMGGGGMTEPGQKVSGSRDAAAVRASASPQQAEGVAGGAKAPDDAARLLAEWRAVNPGVRRYNHTHELGAMARRTIQTLGCGEKLIALINALLLRDDMVDDIFEGEIKKLLAGTESVLHHRAIAGIQSDAKLRRQWSYFAGRGCTAGELREFVRLLAEPADGAAAEMGLLVKAADRDPVSALKAVPAKLGAGSDVNDVSRYHVYLDIIAAASDVATFPAMEAQLRGTPEIATLNVGDTRGKFLAKWGMTDGAGLTGYFNAHPDALPAGDVSSAMSEITRTSPEKAFAMAQQFTFPAHFDRAVGMVLPYVSSKYPKEATALVEQMSPAHDRKLYLDMIKNGLEDDINRD